MISKSNKFISAFLFACIIVATGLTFYIISNPSQGDRFTEFYVLGPSGKAEGYPTNLMVGENRTVILGVVNHEYEDVNYRIVVRLENISITTMNDLILEHEGRLEQKWIFTPDVVGERMKLEFLLYKNGLNETYRTLHLWITVSS